MSPLTSMLKVNIDPLQLTDEQFYQLCIHNPDLNIERNRQGVLIFMPPVGGESGNREIELGIDIGLWNRQTGLGKVFSSSTIFRLPIGSSRSPDVAWIENSRWQALAPEQRQKFPPIAPDFVIELRSRTDDLPTLQDKMQEYIDSGVRLAWLVDPQLQQVEIYRPGQAPEPRPLPTELSDETVLPGFTLHLDAF
ncbi:Uma2 family endonuclease [Synechococcales cyanobacterium C]|uniref:Uma2 family endonuclease n=1 Tax=Petrachloros mirabilis ULC683 TaxID=2781853 RepID=A0A8K2ANA2_9CYAN|nr:Uma2 family endonuclease [Petrachloros mirabilis]NCJ05133.1 Uma2 family endonuclease [Petrachloros mirabilis ULC683]